MRSQRIAAGDVFALLALAAVALAAPQAARADRITEVSIPPNSMDSGCYPAWDNTWTVSAPPYPLDVATGIGWLISDAAPVAGYFALHDHVYASPNVPDPTRAVVTYHFDAPTVVDQIQMIQHNNGIWRIDGYVGDSIAGLAPIGSATAPQPVVEFDSSTFYFGNAVAGRYFRFIITGTDISNGYACYRAFPADVNGQRFAPIPEPGVLSLLAAGACLSLLRRRRQATWPCPEQERCKPLASKRLP